MTEDYFHFLDNTGKGFVGNRSDCFGIIRDNDVLVVNRGLQMVMSHDAFTLYKSNPVLQATFNTYECIKVSEEILKDFRRMEEDTRRMEEDTRRTIEDTRRTIEDTRRTIEDTRRMREDNKVMINDLDMILGGRSKTYCEMVSSQNNSRSSSKGKEC